MRSIAFLLFVLLLTPLAHAGKNILIVGDSLSAGYGIASDRAWPALLEQRLRERALDYTVTNLSISGETSAGGRSRLAGALERGRPTVVVIALGANDGLRGLPLVQLRSNLAAMIDDARKTGARVLLVGMRLPPNYGRYADDFFESFKSTAKSNKVPLLPFLLEPIAGDPGLFQPDRLHPTAEAQPRLLEHVWSALRPLL